LAQRVAEALAGGARVVQYRNKGTDPAPRREEAGVLLALCRAAGALLIVNDDPELAAAVGADGVHLGREDADPREARRRLGDRAVIGVSCYNRIERARDAQALGADYAAFGRFFPSRTKPGAVQAYPQLLRRARRELVVPLVAIGGITPENGRPLITAGAHMLAVVEGVFGADDVRAAARAITELFASEPPVGEPIP
jgi:thiamine-phosphate pyrophosphorylase